MSVTFYMEIGESEDLIDGPNVANYTFGIIREALNIPDNECYCGTWPLDKLPTIQREILKILNGEKRVESLTVPGHQDGPITFQGYDQDRIIRVFTALRDFINEAQKQRRGIYWA